MDNDLMNEDELFFDQMKDQFVTFYLLTVLVMEIGKTIKKNKAKAPNKTATEGKR